MTKSPSVVSELRRDLGQNLGQAAKQDFGQNDGPLLDLAFLSEQTFRDVDLEREVLSLFVTQAKQVVPGLPNLDARAQSDAAHLLKGSARGIGAWTAAAAAAAYETAGPEARRLTYPGLTRIFAATMTAIEAHLARA